jgi:hypothetical protein
MNTRILSIVEKSLRQVLRLNFFFPPGLWSDVHGCLCLGATCRLSVHLSLSFIRGLVIYFRNINLLPYFTDFEGLFIIIVSLNIEITNFIRFEKGASKIIIITTEYIKITTGYIIIPNKNTSFYCFYLKISEFYFRGKHITTGKHVLIILLTCTWHRP